MELCGPLVDFLLFQCCTILDSWVIWSLGFQLELFVSLPCSKGLEWVLSLESSAGWLEMGKNGRFTRIKSPRVPFLRAWVRALHKHRGYVA